MFAGKLVITIRLEYEWAASELPFHIPIWNAVRKESKGNIVECYLTKEVEVVNGNRQLVFTEGIYKILSMYVLRRPSIYRTVMSSDGLKSYSSSRRQRIKRSIS